MVVPFRKLSTKKEAILTSKIDQLIITIGIILSISLDDILQVFKRKCLVKIFKTSIVQTTN